VAHIVTTRLLNVDYVIFNASYIYENNGDIKLHICEKLKGRIKILTSGSNKRQNYRVLFELRPYLCYFMDY